MKKDVVVLVHGMGRTALSWMILARVLSRQGYRVENWGYSSTKWTLEELGAQLGDFVAGLERVGDVGQLHFVGHSLGNILVRWVLVHRPPVAGGRVVMIAPPNQGSASADKYSGIIGWLWPPIYDLRTGEGGVVRGLGDDAGGREVGIIAGKYDGKVSVAESQWAGAKEHVVVPAAHTYIMNRKDVGELVVRFLREGTWGG